MKKNIFLILVLICFLKASSTSDFSFEQSSAQAFYFFNQVLINGRLIESDDWVVAYKNDICVGSRQWDLSQCGGGVCDVPVMGDDGTIGTSGYMLSNEIPNFKVFDSSESVLIAFLLSFLDVLESGRLDIQLRASCTANAAAALTPSSSKT